MSEESVGVLTLQKPMLDNNTYNLMEQLSVESKSLWRIKRNYKSDSAMDNEIREFWNSVERDKEQLVNMLREKLKPPLTLVGYRRRR
ncbi:MAG: hypothetical protein NWE96_08195 [Candidatus Bathyarchaeota archaeon]|nr:hypothetical protein [Candidatus Bathyarchaeota archaeon]